MQALRLHPGDTDGPVALTAAPVTQAATPRPARQLIDLAAVAARIGVSRATAERMHAAGRLPLPIRLGARLLRWDPAELDEWLAVRGPDGALLDRDEWARHRSARNARK